MSIAQDSPTRSATSPEAAKSPNGLAAAILVSSGIGCATLGLAVVLAEASASVKGFLDWWKPAGPLSGKTSVAVLAWLVSGVVLAFLWRTKEVAFRRIAWITGVLVASGFFLTFPPIFERFASH